MPVKDIEINLIDARRVAKRGEKLANIRIDNNSTVTMISPIAGGEAAVEFRYTANYGGIGSIRIEGALTYTGKVEELMTQWASTNNMPDDIASEIHTAVMSACVPEAVTISRDIKLPPPIPLPQINIKKPDKKASKSSQMEVA
jgi:hypothetical protein